MKATGEVATRIVLVDDHPVVLQGLRQIITRASDMEVVATADSPAEALEAVSEHSPDLLIVDLALRGGSGLDVVRQLAGKPGSPVILVVSMHDEVIYAERVLRAGAMGYVMKEESAKNLLRAIRRVLGGEVFLSERMSMRLLSKLVGRPSRQGISDLDSLSDRELEVVRLLGHGYGIREIAAFLSVSVKTVETHRTRARQKLGHKTSRELANYAMRWVQSEKLG